MTSTTSPVKQRKLTDLRVIDLQRELRSFDVLFDKKELKGSLLEKLRQALLNRNIDPDNHLFDTTMDLKSVPLDENNRSHEENGSYEANSLDTAALNIDSDQHLDIENAVQTNPTAKPLANETDDEQTTRMDIMDLRQVVEDRDDDDDDNIFLTIDDRVTTKQEDENNNDKIDYGLEQVSHSLSDEELDSKNPTEQSPDNHFFNHKKESLPTPLSTMGQQTSSDPNPGEEEPHTTLNLPSIDNDTKSKSELDRQNSSNEQQKQPTTNQSNTNPCRIWVSNIAKRTHASDLKTLFSKYGKVLTTKVIGSDSSQWFGYINLASPDDVEKCIHALHQTELHGKKIYVDREMHEEPIRSSSSKSKSTNDTTSSTRQPSARESSSDTHKKRSDQPAYKSSSNDSQKKRDSITNSQDKTSIGKADLSSKKRPASTSAENRKKLSTSDANKSTNDEKTVKSHETDSPTKSSVNSNNGKTNTSSTGANSQSSKYHVSRADAPKLSEKADSSSKSITNDRKNDPHLTKTEKSSSSSYSTDVSKLKTSSPSSHRSHSNEKRSTSSSTKSDDHRSSSTDRSKQRLPSHSTSNKYEKSKETHRTKLPNAVENDRRSVYQNEQRLRHEKEILEHKQFVQQQEEEKIKEQQRRLAEERERVRREFENLERERFEIERTRSALEKEKQEQARELDRQQRRLADEAKFRQQQADAKLRDEKLQRIAHSDSKRPRSSNHESQRSYHSNTNNTTNNISSSSSSSSNKSYDNRSSANTSSGRGRDRSLGDANRDYYPEPKRQYTTTINNSREAAFRDRVAYRESDLPTSTAGLNLNSSSSMASNNPSQRYLPPSSTQHRPSDPYNTLPQRGRDMALPPTSSVSTPYERPARNTVSSPTNNSGALLRRPHSRERYDEREYIQQTQRRDRSPTINSTLRREIMENTHWERPKPRESAHYPDDTHKYLPNSYLSESSQSNQQQGLWSAAPPSRQQQQQQQHHHPDLSLKTASHGPVVDPYGWPRVSQQVPPPPPPSHHPQGLPSSHDRSRANVTSNQRISILASNQPPPPPPSSRGSATSQTHLYSHSGVPVGAMSASQQHASLAPPPPSLHHPAAYVTQQAPPPGLVLHPTGQTRAYEPHYVVTQSLPPRRY